MLTQIYTVNDIPIHNRLHCINKKIIESMNSNNVHQSAKLQHESSLQFLNEVLPLIRGTF